MPTIIIGAKEKGTKVADHASSIDTLIEADKSGNIKKTSFKPSSTNPGQETMQFIDKNFSDTEAFIIGLMQGPPGSKRKIIHVEPGEDIEKVVEKYKQGKLYTEKSDEKNKSDEETETDYGTPKRDGSGKGVRANQGRNPACPPEDYKETGQGSGTAGGRAAESSPQKKAYNLGQDNIGSIVEKYSDAKTAEQKENAAKDAGQYLKEAGGKNLKGKDAENYVAQRLKEKSYSKSDSKKSSGKTNNKGTAKKAA